MSELDLTPAAAVADVVRVTGAGVLELDVFEADVDEPPAAILLEPGEYALVRVTAEGRLELRFGPWGRAAAA